MILVRIVLLPVRLALAVLGITLKVGYQAGRVPVSLTGRVARLFGFKAWLFLVIGVAVGVLFAPGPGRELRGKLQRLLGQDDTSDLDLADKVAFELAHAPRTWHLDQPAVAVVDSRDRLTGSVPDSDVRNELARVAAAIPGVVGVDNHLTVTPADGAGDAGVEDDAVAADAD